MGAGVSGLKIWYTDHRLGSDYVSITWEEMAEHVHEMAAVAWDRDCEEVLRGRELGGDLRVLVAVSGDHRHVSLHSNHGAGTCIATWDPVGLRWKRSRSVGETYL